MRLPYTLVEPSDPPTTDPHPPTRAYGGDAAWDLYSSESVPFVHDVQQLVATGIRIAIPHGFTGLILPRSSMALQKFIIPNAPGLIDPNYRGEIKVILRYLGHACIVLEAGMRIAQLLLIRCHTTDSILEALDPTTFDQLHGDTDRGLEGFGSSGP